MNAIDELAGYPQWVCWRSDPPLEPGKKHRKVPVDPKTGRNASTTDAATWGSADQALDAVQAHPELAGTGFVFTRDDPFAGVDLDGCIDPETGDLALWAAALLGRINSYTEVSPSGTGLHVIVRASIPIGGNRKGPLELYDRERYFTMTARQYPGTPDGIERRHRIVRELHEELFGAADAAMPARPQPARGPVDASDAVVLDRMFGASNGVLVRRLWDGDTSRYDGDDSRADFALIGHLLYWTHGDRDRADHLFRESGLYRDKWTEKRGKDTYGQRTLARAGAR